MRRRLSLAVLVLYAAAAIADGAYRLAEPPTPSSHPNALATLSVTFCAALFWPIDVAVRYLL
jgi:hypothetical protein